MKNPVNKNTQFSNRLMGLQIGFVVAVLLFIAYLFCIQVLDLRHCKIKAKNQRRVRMGYDQRSSSGNHKQRSKRADPKHSRDESEAQKRARTIRLPSQTYACIRRNHILWKMRINDVFITSREKRWLGTFDISLRKTP